MFSIFRQHNDNLSPSTRAFIIHILKLNYFDADDSAFYGLVKCFNLSLPTLSARAYVELIREVFFLLPTLKRVFGRKYSKTGKVLRERVKFFLSLIK